MADYHILMILPEREREGSSKNVASEMVEYLKNHNAVDSDSLRYADEDGDHLCFNIVKECQETSNELLKEDKKYHGIVFDMANQCFSEAFFAYTKENLSKNTSLIKLVDSVVCEWSGQSYFLSEEDNILQIAKHLSERSIIDMIFSSVKKPTLNIILSQSFSHQIDDIEEIIRDKYLPIIVGMKINIISSIDIEPASDIDLGLLSKRNFFNIFVLEKDSFDDENYLRLILETKNNSLVTYWRNVKISDFDKFFSAQKNKLKKFSNADIEKLKTTISSKSKINNFHCYLYNGAKNILFHINKKLLEGCQYISISAGLTELQAKARFDEILNGGKQQRNSTSAQTHPLQVGTIIVRGGQLSLLGSVNN